MNLSFQGLTLIEAISQQSAMLQQKLATLMNGYPSDNIRQTNITSNNTNQSFQNPQPACTPYELFYKTTSPQLPYIFYQPPNNTSAPVPQLYQPMPFSYQFQPAVPQFNLRENVIIKKEGFEVPTQAACTLNQDNLFKPPVLQNVLALTGQKLIEKAQEIPRESFEQKSRTFLEARKESDDDSLNDSPDLPINCKMASGTTYKCRNVFKSIIRHMYTYSKKNRDTLIAILLKAGYQATEIEHGFFELSNYSELEQHNVTKKQTERTVKKMVSKKSVFTYMIRECLQDLINKWENGKLGRVAENNLHIYKEVCKVYYNEAIKTLQNEEQGSVPSKFIKVNDIK